LLFINLFPLQALTYTVLLYVWLTFSISCFVAAFLLSVATYLRVENAHERRQLRAVSLALLLFAAIVAHNFLARNWTGWSGTAPPAAFSLPSLAAEYILFLLVPLTLTYCVLRQDTTQITC
jgi:hypothetical protein